MLGNIKKRINLEFDFEFYGIKYLKFNSGLGIYFLFKKMCIIWGRDERGNGLIF